MIRYTVFFELLLASLIVLGIYLAYKGKTKNLNFSYMDVNNMNFWQSKYLETSTGWDLGRVSPPLKAYFDQLKDKEVKILIPGAGNAYEAEYLHEQGFTNVYVVDWASKALENLKLRMPSFPSKHLFVEDFFKIDRYFDLII